MPSVIVSLSLSADDYLAHYGGSAKDIIAKSLDGRNVRFPATLLRQFVSHSGVQGIFKLVYNQENKFTHIERLS